MAWSGEEGGVGWRGDGIWGWGLDEVGWDVIR